MRKADSFIIQASLWMPQMSQVGDNVLVRSTAKLLEEKSFTVAYLGGNGQRVGAVALNGSVD